MQNKDQKRIEEECEKLSGYIENLLTKIKTEDTTLIKELEFLYEVIKNKYPSRKKFEMYVGRFFDLLPSHASKNLEEISKEKTELRQEICNFIKENNINGERLEKLLNRYYSQKRDLLNAVALLELVLPVYTSLRIKGYSHKELTGLDFLKIS